MFVFEYDVKNGILEVLSYSYSPMFLDDYVVLNFNNMLSDIYVTSNADSMLLDKHSMFSNTSRTLYDIPSLSNTVSSFIKMADNLDFTRYAFAYFTACDSSVILGLQNTQGASNRKSEERRAVFSEGIVTRKGVVSKKKYKPVAKKVKLVTIHLLTEYQIE